jgi:hypothetical protein
VLKCTPSAGCPLNPLPVQQPLEPCQHFPRILRLNIKQPMIPNTVKVTNLIWINVPRSREMNVHSDDQGNLELFSQFPIPERLCLASTCIGL